MDILTIAPTQEAILLALAQYKFLTISQMLDLGIATHRPNIQKHLERMRNRKRPMIASIEFGTVPKKGRLENIHYLKPYGKSILSEDLQIPEQDIKIPIGRNSFFYRDYYHRKNSIDVEIALNKYADTQGDTVLFFDRYFDKVGNNRIDKNLQAKTRIQLKNDRYLIADGIFKINTTKGDKLYCFEMYNGKDTGRTYRQLYQYLEAFATGSPSIMHNHDKGFRVLAVFEFESILQAVLNRLKKNSIFDKVRAFYLLKSLESATQGNIFDDWITADGTKSTLY